MELEKIAILQTPIEILQRETVKNDRVGLQCWSAKPDRPELDLSAAESG
jgi:hypothetical protein